MGESASNVRAGGAFIEIGARDKQLRETLRGAKAKVKALGRSLASVGKAFLAAGAGIGAALLKPIADAGNFEETLSKFNAVFKEQAPLVRDWAKALAEGIGRSEPQLLAFLSTLQDTFVPLGFARTEATELSKRLVKLALDLGSFNNIADVEVIRSLQSAITGQGEAVRKFGVILVESTLNQALLNMGISGGVRRATEQQKAMARLAVILSSTSDAQGDAARTAGSYQNQLKAATAAVEGLSIATGNVLLPQVTAFVKQITLLVNGVKAFVKENPKLITGISQLGKALLSAGAVILSVIVSFKALAILFSPAGIIGLMVAAGLLFLDVLGLIDTGVLDIMDTVRLGGFTLTTQFKVAAKVVEKLWIEARDSVLDAWEQAVFTFQNIANLIKFAFAGVGEFISDAVLSGLKKADRALVPFRQGLVIFARDLGLLTADAAERAFVRLEGGSFQDDLEKLRASNKQIFQEIQDDAAAALDAPFRELQENRRAREGEQKEEFSKIDQEIRRLFRTEVDLDEAKAARKRKEREELLKRLDEQKKLEKSAASVAKTTAAVQAKTPTRVLGAFAGRNLSRLVASRRDASLVDLGRAQLEVQREIARSVKGGVMIE